jgi:hypothetical protein
VGGQHLQRDGVQNRYRCKAVVAVLHLLVQVRGDGDLDTRGLHVDLHQHRPLVVIGTGERQILDGGVRFLDRPPDDDLRSAAALGGLGESDRRRRCGSVCEWPPCGSERRDIRPPS